MSFKQLCCSGFIAILSIIIYFLSTIRYDLIAAKISGVYPGAFTKNAIYNASTYYNWTYLLRDNYATIRDEFYEYEKISNSYCYQNPDYRTNWDQKWTTISLYAWGSWEINSKYFPKTMEIIKEIQQHNWIRLAEFSILQSGKFIPRHKGVYAGQLTYQLTIEVSDEIVKKSDFDWQKELYLAVWDNTSLPLTYFPSEYIPNKEPSLLSWLSNGSDVLFDDSCVHEAFNNLTKRRVVLIIDPERTDHNFKQSYTAQIVHKLVQIWIPILKGYQEYINMEALNVVNPYIKDDAYNCKFEGIIESNNHYDYNRFGGIRNEKESNASSVRMQWYKLMNDTKYIYDIYRNTKYVTKKQVNFDKIILIIVIVTAVITFIVMYCVFN